CEICGDACRVLDPAAAVAKNEEKR
ncbi:MAG: hypothetical protein ACD_74C00071G0001, partial [uncultured bacterium]